MKLRMFFLTLIITSPYTLHATEVKITDGPGNLIGCQLESFKGKKTKKLVEIPLNKCVSIEEFREDALPTLLQLQAEELKQKKAECKRLKSQDKKKCNQDYRSLKNHQPFEADWYGLDSSKKYERSLKICNYVKDSYREISESEFKSGKSPDTGFLMSSKKKYYYPTGKINEIVIANDTSGARIQSRQIKFALAASKLNPSSLQKFTLFHKEEIELDHSTRTVMDAPKDGPSGPDLSIKCFAIDEMDKPSLEVNDSFLNPHEGKESDQSKPGRKSEATRQ